MRQWSLRLAFLPRASFLPDILQRGAEYSATVLIDRQVAALGLIGHAATFRPQQVRSSPPRSIEDQQLFRSKALRV